MTLWIVCGSPPNHEKWEFTGARIDPKLRLVFCIYLAYLGYILDRFIVRTLLRLCEAFVPVCCVPVAFRLSPCSKKTCSLEDICKTRQGTRKRYHYDHLYEYKHTSNIHMWIWRTATYNILITKLILVPRSRQISSKGIEIYKHGVKKMKTTSSTIIWESPRASNHQHSCTSKQAVARMCVVVELTLVATTTTFCLTRAK